MSLSLLIPIWISSGYHPTLLRHWLYLQKKWIPSSTPHAWTRPNWNPTLKQAQSLSKQRYREWVKGGQFIDPCHPLKQAYKNAKRAFRREFRKWQREKTEEFYNSLNPSDPAIFRKVKAKLRGNPTPTSFIKIGSQTHHGDSLPEGWASYFESLHKFDQSGYDHVHLQYVIDEVQRISRSEDNVDDLLLFSTQDIQAMIKSLPKRKACSLDSLAIDSLAMEHIIHAPPISLRYVVCPIQCNSSPPFYPLLVLPQPSYTYL